MVMDGNKILVVSRETHRRVMAAKIPRKHNVEKGRWVMESVNETVARALDALERELKNE